MKLHSSKQTPGGAWTRDATARQALLVVLGAGAAGWLATALPAAEPAAGQADEQEIAEELKEQADPTILKRRLWLDTEWNKFKDGRHDVETTLGGLWAWRVSTNQDWGVRLKVPYDWQLAGDAAGDSDEHGLGDIKVATGTARHLGHSWRAAAGLELRLPTAQDGLGDDDWRLQEFAAGAWDVNRWFTLSPSAEYNQSVAERHGAPPQHYLETYFPATVLLPHRWSLTAQYEAKVDFESDNDVTHSAKLLVAKQLAHPPLRFALSIKRPFDSGEKEFQVNFVITYHFR